MPTTIKAALKKWEDSTGKKAAETKEIKLIGVYPPIEKMDGPLHQLLNCEKFSLSTNMISTISNLQSFKNLKILSLGRNAIKSFQGIEAACETLEQVWISYNLIDRLKPIRTLSKLKVLHMAHNCVRDWRELEHLSELPCLDDLVKCSFESNIDSRDNGNPIEEEISPAKYIEEVTKRLLLLKKLDGYPVIRDLLQTGNLNTLNSQELNNLEEDEYDEDGSDGVNDEEDEQEQQSEDDEDEQDVLGDDRMDSQSTGSSFDEQDQFYIE